MVTDASPVSTNMGTDGRVRLLVSEESELRQKNQITVPRQIARSLGLEQGDRLLFEIREGEPNEVHMRRLRENYTGVLAGVYGSSEEAARYLREEREAWAD
jgi:AbrB family looped-hinge helix DNA binding protein